MALSVSDRQFYKEKLSTKNLLWLVGSTMVVGGIGWPLLRYVQDMQDGLGKLWTIGIAVNMATIGLMMGCIVGVIMYFFFQFLLAMEWLPSRR